MKVMHINCVYNEGSTGKIIDDINRFLKDKGHEWAVCYGSGTKPLNKHVYKATIKYETKINKRITYFTGFQYGGAPLSTIRVINAIKKEKPDIVHLHSINCYFVNIYKLINYLKKNNVCTVVTNHAEFLYTGSCSHSYECKKWMSGCGKCDRLQETTTSKVGDTTNRAWEKMKKCFIGFNNIEVVSVSDWGRKRVEASPIFNSFRQATILNGIDSKNIFYPRECNEVREELNLKPREKIILHVTANFSPNRENIKGSCFVVQLAEKLLKYNVRIIIIGPSSYNQVLPRNIIVKGKIHDQEKLAQYYSLADLTLITSKRETFSMPCAESLCCGTPVVGFQAGGPESITLKEYSEFVEYGNIEMLEKAIHKWINIKSEGNAKIIANIAKQYYSAERMAQEYLDIYTRLIKGSVVCKDR